MLKSESNSRKQQLEELRSFTETVNKEIVDIVGVLGWTVDSVINVDKEYLTCPYDSSHRLTEESLNDHLISCQWKAEGYGSSDIPLSEPLLPEDSPLCVKFEKQLQAEVLRKAYELDPTMKIGTGERLIPRTSHRLITDFTGDERRALYDYVIAHTEKPDIGRDIADISNLKPQEKKDKEPSFLELLMQERNLKRRRAKHRGVHTNKKSQTEILREVINQQMETYMEYTCGRSDAAQAIDVPNIKTRESCDETKQDRAERLYKAFHGSSRNYNDFSSAEGNSGCYNKRDYLKREHSVDRGVRRRSKERDKRERYLDERDERERRKREHSGHGKSARVRSRDGKSHKKQKHRSKDKHKDKYHERKRRSRDRDRSSERHYSRHSDRKRKLKDKE